MNLISLATAMELLPLVILPHVLVSNTVFRISTITHISLQHMYYSPISSVYLFFSFFPVIHVQLGSKFYNVSEGHPAILEVILSRPSVFEVLVKITTQDGMAKGRKLLQAK